MLSLLRDVRQPHRSLRLTEYAPHSGLSATIGLVSILTICCDLNRHGGHWSHVHPPTPRSTTHHADLFHSKPLGEIRQPGFWRRRCGGAGLPPGFLAGKPDGPYALD